MPEGPEVETVVRSLAPRLTGRRIRYAAYLSQRVSKGPSGLLPLDEIRNQTIHKITRHGKYIVVKLDRGVLTIHLRMTGKLLLDATPGPYTRARFVLDRGELLFNDTRQFGRIWWSETIPEAASRLGPDPLEMDERDFVPLLKGRKARIKPLLLNQLFLRGIGNIYADEALFDARIHPLANAAKLSRERARRLFQSIRKVLRDAIASRGSSIIDYVDASGKRGSYQSKHKVYGREGKPCASCGAPIRRIVVGQRGTHYCARCQRV